MPKWFWFQKRPVETADRIIRSYVVRAGALGVAGSVALHCDIFILMGLWSALILALAQFHGVELGTEDAAKIAVALLASAGTFLAGFLAANIYFKMSILGIPAALTLNAAIDALLTCFVGVVVSIIFASGNRGRDDGGGSGPDIDPDWLARIADAFARLLGLFSLAFLVEWVKGGASPQLLRTMMERRGISSGSAHPA